MAGGEGRTGCLERGPNFSTLPLEIQIPGAEIEPLGILMLTTPTPPGPHHTQLRIIRYSRGSAATQGETAPPRVSLLLRGEAMWRIWENVWGWEECVAGPESTGQQVASFPLCPGASDEASSSSLEAGGGGWASGVLLELARFLPGRGKLGKPRMPSWPEVGCHRLRRPPKASLGAVPSGRREDWVPCCPPNMQAHSHLSTLAPLPLPGIHLFPIKLRGSPSPSLGASGFAFPVRPAQRPYLQFYWAQYFLTLPPPFIALAGITTGEPYFTPLSFVFFLFPTIL